MAAGSLDRQKDQTIYTSSEEGFRTISAVSSESHEPASEPGRAAAPEPATGQADFGANEWLVEELYQRYLADPGSVDRAWWSFFADYQPTLPNGTAPQPAVGRQSAAPAQAPSAAGWPVGSLVTCALPSIGWPPVKCAASGGLNRGNHMPLPPIVPVGTGRDRDFPRRRGREGGE